MGRGVVEVKRRFVLILLLGSYLIFGFVLPSFANLPKLSLPQSRTLKNENQVIKNQTDEGKVLYDAGKFAEAVERLQKAVQEYKQQGQTQKQAVTLGNLSLAYQETGKWQEAKQAITESLQLQGLNIQNKNQKLLLAKTLMIQGKLFLSIGQSENALKSWQQAEKLFGEVGETNSRITAKINQTQALQILGFYRSAMKILQEVNTTLKSQPDSIQKVISLRSFGEAQQIIGDLKEANIALQESLKIAQRLQNPDEISASLLSLGNHARICDKQSLMPEAYRTTEALNYYKQTFEFSSSPLIKVQAHLNQLSLLRESKKDTTTIISEIQILLQQLPPSRNSIYAQINFAENLVKMGISSPSPANILKTAIQQAENIEDIQAQAYGWGELGKLSELAKEFPQAQKLTEKAILLSQNINTPEITYQLQWQLGRLQKAQGNIKTAIASYDIAIEALQALRSDLVAINRDIQFSFRESVEPVYRESVALLLQDPTLKDQNGQANPKILDKARQRIEALQLAELDNFFREACLQGQKVILDRVVDRDNPKSAILYPIILADTIQIIVKLPNQPLKLYTSLVKETEVEQTVTKLRQDLTDPSAIRDLKMRSQQVYKWLIKPIEADLAKTPVNTLVFVLDGVLRNLPMSALFDGEKYLVEKYALSLSPGLQLFNPKPIVNQKLKALTAGLTQPPKNFPHFAPLQGIESEFELITKAGINTTSLLNEKFTSTALEREINETPFNIVHLATHGQFSSRVDDTFILAADGAINVRQFDNLLRDRDDARPEALQLLVLSACQTAEGDKRAVLGLAGIAIGAGARSTIASLWQIDDESTAMFVGSFYSELKKGISKAEALQHAQLKLLNHPNYKSPSYWSAYVLIGNWL
ncbi:MAG: CHAT domain-containing protein [Methylacidiphilales bacterium]|nr:CHAT domain-containing protein [Candidatus Methylacidiphilales bacterium]